MNTIKRLVISVKSRIDQVAGDLENHEALAEAAIAEMSELQRRLRRQKYRLGRECQQAEEALGHLEAEAERWKRRAIRVREQDEAKALECVRRLKVARHRIARQRQMLENLETQRDRLQRDLERVEARLAEMRQRKTLLAARQVQGARRPLPAMPEDSLEAVFERWEEQIAVDGCEEAEALPAGMDLEEAFRREEEQAELKALLADLDDEDQEDTP